MKKLYVLVFLIMFIGKLFCSSIVDDNVRNKFNIGKDYVKITDKEFIDQNPYYRTLVGKYLDLYKTDLLNISKFLEASSIKSNLIKRSNASPTGDYIDDVVLNIESKMLKDNPWDTIAPKVFAEKFGLKKSSLKSMGIGNWIREAILQGTPLTLEQRFMIRLQKALIEKISRMTDAKEIIEPLKALLLANDKIPAEFGKKSITEIFGSITDADTKKAVMLEIMEQLKSVTIERDGNIGDRKNTLAELVLDNITDVNMRRALVAVAKKLEENKSKGIGYSDGEAFLKQMINDPSKKYYYELHTGINEEQKDLSDYEGRFPELRGKNINLNYLIPDFTPLSPQEYQPQTQSQEGQVATFSDL